MLKKPKIVDARRKPTFSQSVEALKAMHKHDVEPTPENYAIWYHEAGGNNEALSNDIQNIRTQKFKFTPGVCKRLYDEHIKPEMLAEDNKKINELMGKLMAMIKRYATQADEYNAELDKQTNTLSDKIAEDSNLEGLLGDVVGKLKDLQADSEGFNSQMKNSQDEISKLRENLEKATTEAREDDLTKLKNRRAFDEIIEALTQNARENEENLCLLMIDIDHFKSFNDTWGHQIGDEVLKVVSGALRRTVRGGDIVSRYGGEEFAVLLPDTAANGAHIVAENIRKLIANNRLKRKNSTEELGQITVSIGVSRFHASDENDSIEAFIKRADDALYNAKQNGRNRVSLEL